MKRIYLIFVLSLTLGVAAFIPYRSVASDFSGTQLIEQGITIRTQSKLPAPGLISPANGATVGTGQLTFSWNAVPGAARYHLQAGLGTAFDGQFNIIERWSLTDPSHTFNITPGFVFYFPHLFWRVQAIDANNVAGEWSEVRYFNLTSR